MLPECSSFFLPDKSHAFVCYLLYVFVWIYPLTTKNNHFMLALLRIAPFVYIACPP